MLLLKQLKMSVTEKDSYWLIDGGASMHITPHLSDFSNYNEFTKPTLIQTANKNAMASILGKGQVYLKFITGQQKSEMMIENNYMPDCLERLLSTGSLKKVGFCESSD